ncbi:acyl-CoA thioesterase [Microvirga sp. 2YAF29]|uniref:acyl-CoA thioesterase n=1 Tax=Microvirga sp. 2YAF29 TaxID=3233031 RepID=UPI003F9DE776
MSIVSTATCLIDIVFPGDTNHHGTLFGGIGLAHMDKVAFIAASRHAHVDFVTASCERIDFEAPAHMGEIVELTGRITGRHAATSRPRHSEPRG